MLEVTRGREDNTIIKVDIQTCQIFTELGVLYTESESIAIRMGISEVWKGNTGTQSTGTKARTILEMEIIGSVLDDIQVRV